VSGPKGHVLFDGNAELSDKNLANKTSSVLAVKTGTTAVGQSGNGNTSLKNLQDQVDNALTQLDLSKGGNSGSAAAQELKKKLGALNDELTKLGKFGGDGAAAVNGLNKQFDDLADQLKKLTEQMKNK